MPGRRRGRSGHGSDTSGGAPRPFPALPAPAPDPPGAARFGGAGGAPAASAEQLRGPGAGGGGRAGGPGAPGRAPADPDRPGRGGQDPPGPGGRRGAWGAPSPTAPSSSAWPRWPTRPWCRTPWPGPWACGRRRGSPRRDARGRLRAPAAAAVLDNFEHLLGGGAEVAGAAGGVPGAQGPGDQPGGAARLRGAGSRCPRWPSPRSRRVPAARGGPGAPPVEAVRLFLERAAGGGARRRPSARRTRPGGGARSAGAWTGCPWRSSWRRARCRHFSPAALLARLDAAACPCSPAAPGTPPARQQTLRADDRLELRPPLPGRAGPLPAPGRLRRPLHPGRGRRRVRARQGARAPRLSLRACWTGSGAGGPQPAAPGGDGGRGRSPLRAAGDGAGVRRGTAG